MSVVNQGSTNDNKIFLCTTNNTASLGSDTITFSQVTPQNAGTVTSIVAGTGLTGGTITSSGTIAVDVGTSASKIVQLDGSAKLPAVDGSQLTNLNAASAGFAVAMAIAL